MSKQNTMAMAPIPSTIIMLIIYSFICISLASLSTPASAWSWSPPPGHHTPSATKDKGSVAVSRNDFIRRFLTCAPATILIASSSSPFPKPANAAPPFAVMEEELGYYPVTDERSGATVMVPAKAKRRSTDQSVALAKHLQSTKATMYGAFWCPHCSRQKELFGKEAWAYVTYVECAPKGYRSRYATCLEKGVDGYPSWTFGNGKEQGGEMELAAIAKMSGFKGAFDATLETGVPPLGGGACQ